MGDHFNCSNPHCKVPLLGIGFVEEGGQLFCEQDYEKYFAPRCGKCGAAILRECVNALKDTFHPECFLCFHCGKPIGSGQFHVEDGKTYCEKDWKARAFMRNKENLSAKNMHIASIKMLWIKFWIM